VFLKLFVYVHWSISNYLIFILFAVHNGGDSWGKELLALFLLLEDNLGSLNLPLYNLMGYSHAYYIYAVNLVLNLQFRTLIRQNMYLFSLNITILCLYYFLTLLDHEKNWLYATPLSRLCDYCTVKLACYSGIYNGVTLMNLACV